MLFLVSFRLSPHRLTVFGDRDIRKCKGMLIVFFFLYSFQAKLWIIFLQALMDHLTQTEGGTGGKKIQKVTEHVVISDFSAAKAVRRLSAGLNEGVEYGILFFEHR